MSEPYRELLLGCGHDTRKRYCAVAHHPRGWRDPKGPVTLDVNPLIEADLWCDLNSPPPWYAMVRDDPDKRMIEMLSDYWDEIHAYQVLEHLGRLGDCHAFFSHFAELWRLLKPNGYLVAEVPSRQSGNLWGDPGHTRAIVAESIMFLSQEQYRLQLDGPVSTRTSMSDYRHVYKADFKIVELHEDRKNMVFVLQALKPDHSSDHLPCGCVGGHEPDCPHR